MADHVSLEDRTELLRSIPLFEGLDDEDLLALGRSVTPRTFRAGQLVFQQGEVGRQMYLIADGHVNIHLPGDQSRRVSLKDIARGEYFGELSLFDEKPRSASALVTTDAVLLELSRSTLSRYLDKRPRAAMAILRTMAERLRETNTLLSQRMAKNAMKELEQRLSWSDRLADRVASLNGSWTFIVGLILLTIAWTCFNSGLVSPRPFDAYPYVFFNLVLAILVALQGPLIVMSQNRQTRKDRAQSEADYKVNLKNEVNIETILRELGEFRAEMNLRSGSTEGREPVSSAMRSERPTSVRMPSGDE